MPFEENYEDRIIEIHSKMKEVCKKNGFHIVCFTDIEEGKKSSYIHIKATEPSQGIPVGLGRYVCFRSAGFWFQGGGGRT